jgi:hypothetical protein
MKRVVAVASADEKKQATVEALRAPLKSLVKIS